MESEALPLTSVTVARAVAPSLNVTVPVGTPAAEVTVALRVTACPVVDGFGVEVRVVVVAAGVTALTTCGTTVAVLAAKMGLAPGAGVKVGVRRGSVEMEIEAPSLTRV